MQIQFDPRDPNACASVLAVITALHGSTPFDLARASGRDSLAFGDPLPDPAAAFDAPSPESAFPPAPFASPAPTADIAGAAAGFTATPTSAPVAAEPTTPPPPAPIAATASEAPAPAPQAAPGASHSSGVELDADGLPWDARIHSGPADKRPKNGDGRWRRARGVSDEQAAPIIAELRQVMGAPAPAPTQAAAPTPAPAPQPTPAPVPVPASPPPAPVAAAPIPAPAAPPPTPVAVDTASGPAAAAPASETVATFADLMKKITRMQTAGLVTVEGAAEIARSLGLTGVRDMINRPDLVPAFDALLPAEAA